MKDHMVWNCVLLGYRLKATYMSYQGHLNVKLEKILKIYTLTYLQQLSFHLQNMYEIDNLVIVLTHSDYNYVPIYYIKIHTFEMILT